MTLIVTAELIVIMYNTKQKNGQDFGLIQLVHTFIPISYIRICKDNQTIIDLILVFANVNEFNCGVMIEPNINDYKLFQISFNNKRQTKKRLVSVKS